MSDVLINFVSCLCFSFVFVLFLLEENHRTELKKITCAYQKKTNKTTTKTSQKITVK